ncbi:LysR family transcriptional regulator [Sphingomonas japonica]|uniref:DNA-binding transcriptional LysR family regulator n=1 Tax=Sphingomonas japonica TaxID=511662 RepID=A0ABX0TVW7_9SPHN|nr:LysR family transcriptional regulator [Sphingomonas japonica]NIJ22464.1 DNA-binding transcriptional LysR family regulator [Sphingomonas japonica]
MDRDVWSGLAVFAEIVEAGSFAAAAKRLGISSSALSHAMRSLEARLNVRLLNRTTRSLAPTDAGQILLARLQPALSSVADILGELDSVRSKPIGRVRVNAHKPAASYLILPRLPKFSRDHPEVSIDLTVDDGMVDIVAERFDCGVRHDKALQADMISARISGPLELVFVASPAYLDLNGRPGNPEALGSHRCISYRHATSGVIHRWEFAYGGERTNQAVPTSFVTNDIDIMRDAALRGLGICCLLVDQAAVHLRSGDLVEVMSGWAPALPPCHIYYPTKRQPTAAFQAFLAAMREF